MTIVEQITKHQIPKTTVAVIAGMPLASVSRYCKSVDLVSATYAARIEEAVADIVSVIQMVESARETLSASGVPTPLLNLSDTKTLKELIALNKKTETARKEELEAVARGWKTAQDLCSALQK